MAPRIHLARSPKLLRPTDITWPARLADLPDPPESLQLAGYLPDLSEAVAIVGTRAAHDDALEFARALGRDLAEAGCPVISGGAAGIDSAAHLGALEAGGSTVAVLATGVEHAYPAHHAGLFSEIARSGALLCEFDGPGVSGRWAFLQRNRLVAALAHAVVIVQAPVRSGALSTARWAKRLKRRVLAVPAAPWDVRGAGCLELVMAGAEICTCAADILSKGPRGVTPAPRRVRMSQKIANDGEDLGAKNRAVWKLIQQGPCHPDRISVTLDMPAAEVQEALLTLLLCGRCRQRADGSYESNV